MKKKNRRRLLEMAWDESQHPRGKKGTHEGGKFAKKKDGSKWTYADSVGLISQKIAEGSKDVAQRVSSDVIHQLAKIHYQAAIKSRGSIGSMARMPKKKWVKMSHGALQRSVVLCLAHGDVEETRDPLVFEKEVARVGRFQKRDFKFSISERAIDHWVETFQKRKARGIDCPVPIEHTKNPEKRRGTVLALAKRPNSKGETALFAKIKFRDVEAAKLAASGVSIFVPHEDEDGYGNKYAAPVQHIAITDYPVIAGLEPFRPIACSFDSMELAFPPPKGEQPAARDGDDGKGDEKKPDEKGKLTLRDVASQLGVGPEVTDEQQLLQAILQAVAQMRQAPQQTVARPPMPPMMQRPMMPHGAYAGRPPIAMSRTKRGLDLPEEVLMALSKKQFKKLMKKKGKKAPELPEDDELDLGLEHDEPEPYEGPQALSGSVLEGVRENRQMKIDRLFQQRKITPVVKKRLEERFVKGQTVALSHEYDDGFNDLIKDFSENGSVLPGGRTGPQVLGGAVALSHANGEEQNPLVADAERRAEGKPNFAN